MMDKKKTIIGIIIGILMIIIALSLFAQPTKSTDTANITIKELDFDRYGLAFDRTLYGWIDTTDNKTYYVTLNQMASLYYGSNETFEYVDGITIKYHLENNGTNYVVDKLYYRNGTEIPKVSSEQEDVFGANSPRIGVNNKYCAPDFGLTAEESSGY